MFEYETHDEFVDRMDDMMSALSPQGSLGTGGERSEVLISLGDYNYGKISKIGCIKQIRNVTCWGLSETKEFVEFNVPNPVVQFDYQKQAHVTPMGTTPVRCESCHDLDEEYRDNISKISKQNVELQERVSLLERELAVERDRVISLRDVVRMLNEMI